MNNALTAESRFVLMRQLDQQEFDELESGNDQRGIILCREDRRREAGNWNELNTGDHLDIDGLTGRVVRLTVKTRRSSSASRKLIAFNKPVKVFRRMGVTTLAA